MLAEKRYFGDVSASTRTGYVGVGFFFVCRGIPRYIRTKKLSTKEGHKFYSGNPWRIQSIDYGTIEIFDYRGMWGSRGGWGGRGRKEES